MSYSSGLGTPPASRRPRNYGYWKVSDPSILRQLREDGLPDLNLGRVLDQPHNRPGGAPVFMKVYDTGAPGAGFIVYLEFAQKFPNDPAPSRATDQTTTSGAQTDAMRQFLEGPGSASLSQFSKAEVDAQLAPFLVGRASPSSVTRTDSPISGTAKMVAGLVVAAAFVAIGMGFFPKRDQEPRPVLRNSRSKRRSSGRKSSRAKRHSRVLRNSTGQMTVEVKGAIMATSPRVKEAQLAGERVLASVLGEAAAESYFENRRRRDGEKAHITLAGPADAKKAIADLASRDGISKGDAERKVKEIAALGVPDTFDVRGVGRAELGGKIAYFAVVDWPEGRAWRESMGMDPYGQDFHITLGFGPEGDVHGVPKRDVMTPNSDPMREFRIEELQRDIERASLDEEEAANAENRLFILDWQLGDAKERLASMSVRAIEKAQQIIDELWHTGNWGNNPRGVLFVVADEFRGRGIPQSFLEEKFKWSELDPETREALGAMLAIAKIEVAKYRLAESFEDASKHEKEARRMAEGLRTAPLVGGVGEEYEGSAANLLRQARLETRWADSARKQILKTRGPRIEANIPSSYSVDREGIERLVMESGVTGAKSLVVASKPTGIGGLDKVLSETVGVISKRLGTEPIVNEDKMPFVGRSFEFPVPGQSNRIVEVRKVYDHEIPIYNIFGEQYRTMRVDSVIVTLLDKKDIPAWHNEIRYVEDDDLNNNSSSVYAIPKRKAYPITTAEDAYRATQRLKQGRVKSAADARRIIAAIKREHHGIWSKYLSDYPVSRIMSSKHKGVVARRKSSRARKTSRRARR